MDSKQIWVTVIVALVVAVIASSITASIVSKQTTQVALAPWDSLFGRDKVINAHQCNADSECDISEALISGSLNVDGRALIDNNLFVGELWSPIPQGTGKITASDSVLVGSTVDHLLLNSQPTYSEIRSVGGSLQLSSSSGTVYVDADSEFVVRDLAGFNGNGFVCVNANGLIYRSNTACV